MLDDRNCVDLFRTNNRHMLENRYCVYLVRTDKRRMLDNQDCLDFTLAWIVGVYLTIGVVFTYFARIIGAWLTIGIVLTLAQIIMLDDRYCVYFFSPNNRRMLNDRDCVDLRTDKRRMLDDRDCVYLFRTSNRRMLNDRDCLDFSTNNYAWRSGLCILL